MTEIFRKEALQRLSSPERLDQLMQVVSPHDWLVLGTVMVLLGLALTWACVGRLPTTVAGRGVLIRLRKVVEWQAPAAGRLATLTVSVGDVVQKGTVLGTIDQADMHQQLQEDRAKLRDLLAQDSLKDSLQMQQISIQLQQIALEKQALHLQQQDLQKRLGRGLGEHERKDIRANYAEHRPERCADQALQADFFQPDFEKDDGQGNYEPDGCGDPGLELKWMQQPCGCCQNDNE